MYSERGSRSCPTPRFSSGSSHRQCSGSRAAVLTRSSGGDTSREPMEFSAPARLAPPAGNPGGLTPRSREGLPLGLPPRPFPPTGFPEPEPGARLVHGSDNPRGSPSHSPGQHSTAQTSPRPTTSGTLPSEPPLRPSRLRPRAHVSEERLPC